MNMWGREKQVQPGPMNLEDLMELVPPYAKDLKQNLWSLLRQTELTPQQLWGTAVACALVARHAKLLEAIENESKEHLSSTAMDAAKSAAAIMGMNNVYHRFLHLTDNPKYAAIPARLRMNVIRTHGVEPQDFELWCVAVSAIHNCKSCVESHERSALEKGISEETILAAVRIAAVLHALATVVPE